jgi:hypothetical protein
MPHSRVCTIQLDCDPATHAASVEFWSRALNLPPAWSDDLSDPYVPLLGTIPRLQVLLQRVDDRSRMHLDFVSDTVEADVRRLESYGARYERAVSEGGIQWHILRDPSDRYVCVLPRDTPTGAPLTLAALVIDCAAADYDRGVRFWSAALGLGALPPTDPASAYTTLDGRLHNLKLELQRVDDRSRMHLDIETDDVEAEVQRLEALGAQRHALVASWWIMRDPTDLLFCVVPPQTNWLHAAS